MSGPRYDMVTKAEWQSRAEQAEARLAKVEALCEFSEMLAADWPGSPPIVLTHDVRKALAPPEDQGA